MTTKKNIPVWTFLGLLVFLLVGCAPGGYGRLRLAGSQMTIDQLVENWKDYHVSYAGVRVSRPNAVLFDPRDDGKTITLQKYWSPVQDKETLDDLMSWIQLFKFGGPPVLYTVRGPENRIFGYLYSLDNEVTIKVIDDNTLWIDDMTLRPEDKYNVVF